MKINKAFEVRLAQLLSEKNLTIYKMCKNGAIPRSTVTNILSGLCKSPTLATLYQVSAGLGISLMEFLDCEVFRDENIDF